MSIANPGELRVVLNINVHISAFAYPHGRLFQLWRKALSGRYKLLVSPAIVNEIADVVRLKFTWGDDRIIARLKCLPNPLTLWCRRPLSTSSRKMMTITASWNVL